MLTEIKEKLKKTLPEKRYIHSLGVADEAKRLAEVYGCDADKAYLAGLLHDCAKGIPTDRQIAECDRRGVCLDEWTRMCPPVVHSFLGEQIARDEYGVTDGEILKAIRLHTVGGKGMTLLDKIIYLADLTEKNRDFPGVEELRKASDKGIDEAIKLSIKRQTQFNMAKDAVIHPAMLYLWNDIILSGDTKTEGH